MHCLLMARHLHKLFLGESVPKRSFFARLSHYDSSQVQLRHTLMLCEIGCWLLPQCQGDSTSVQLLPEVKGNATHSYMVGGVRRGVRFNLPVVLCGYAMR